MKVTTDACVHGSWTPIEPEIKNILEIGCGTGIITLMLCQRIPNATVCAVEIDGQAAIQAQENFEASKWRDRIKVMNQDARELVLSEKFDLIICNPPYFLDSLRNPDIRLRTARHDDTLTFKDLVTITNKFLAPNGILSVMYPDTEFAAFERFMSVSGYYLRHKLLMKHRPSAKVNRMVGVFVKELSNYTEEELFLFNEDYTSSSKFIELLQPFYLYL